LIPDVERLEGVNEKKNKREKKKRARELAFRDVQFKFE